MVNSNEYDKLQGLINTYQGQIAILEDEIDVNLQFKYFKVSESVKKDLDKEAWLSLKHHLTDVTYGIENKRILLNRLASVGGVDAFRTLEAYMKNPDAELREWSILAYQESRLLLESELLEEAPLFISTGLGGKGQSLRYFIAVTTNDRLPFNEVQQHIVESEFAYGLKAEGGELEEALFNQYTVAITCLIPFRIHLQNCIDVIVQKCNELGNFVNESYVVTNVKKMTFEEIESALTNYEQKEVENDNE